MEKKPHLDLLPPDLHGGERVGLRQDGDDVNLLMESFHEFHIQGPQTKKETQHTFWFKSQCKCIPLQAILMFLSAAHAAKVHRDMGANEDIFSSLFLIHFFTITGSDFNWSAGGAPSI